MATKSNSANARVAAVASVLAMTIALSGWVPTAGATGTETTTGAYPQTYTSIRYAFEGGDEAVRDALLSSLARAWPTAELEYGGEDYSFANLAAVEERAARNKRPGAAVVLARVEDDGGGVMLLDIRFLAQSRARVSDSGTVEDLRDRYTGHFRSAGEEAASADVEPSRSQDDRYDSSTPSRARTLNRVGVRLAFGVIVDHSDHHQTTDSIYPEDQPARYYPRARFLFGPSFDGARFWERPVAVVYGSGLAFSRGRVREFMTLGGATYDSVVWRAAFYAHAAALWSNARRQLRAGRLGVSVGGGFVLQANIGDSAIATAHSRDSVSLASTLTEERRFSADLQLVLRFDVPSAVGLAVAFDVRAAQSLRPIWFGGAFNETRLETGMHVVF